jgi:hypothetical protein
MYFTAALPGVTGVDRCRGHCLGLVPDLRRAPVPVAAAAGPPVFRGLASLLPFLFAQPFALALVPAPFRFRGAAQYAPCFRSLQSSVLC